MKRSIALLLLLLVLTLLAAPALAVPVLPADMVLVKNAHLRAKPSEDGASKMILMQGTHVTVEQLQGRWVLVRYGNFTGYILDELVKEPNSLDENLITGGERQSLRLGMRGEEVYALQDKLILLGYLFGAPDGYFGEDTQRAVISLQTACNLTPDGVVGKTTFAMLDMLLAGQAVEKVL